MIKNIIVTIIVALAVTGGVLFYAQTYMEENENPEVQVLKMEIEELKKAQTAELQTDKDAEIKKIVEGELEIFKKEQIENSPTFGWETYTSEIGFSFKYPPQHSVSDTEHFENKGDKDARYITIVELDENGEAVPPVEMVISVWPNYKSQSFSLWEGIEWKHFNEVRNSFTLDN